MRKPQRFGELSELTANLNACDRRGRANVGQYGRWNEWWLGRLLGELGVRSKTMRASDALGKGYMLADIDAAFRRYVPTPICMRNE